MSFLPPELHQLIDLAGVAVFAVSGALAALRARMDLLGVAVVAAVTAIGGGTTRDLLLDRHPVFWIDDPVYLGVILAAAAATILWTRVAQPPMNSLAFADALGLAFFVITGAALTLQAGHHWGIVILMGTVTGVAGGVIRDVLSARVPMILRRGELYATAAIAGAGLFLLLLSLGASETVASLGGMGLVLALRLSAILLGLRLPVLGLSGEGPPPPPPPPFSLTGPGIPGEAGEGSAGARAPPGPATHPVQGQLTKTFLAPGVREANLLPWRNTGWIREGRAAVPTAAPTRAGGWTRWRTTGRPGGPGAGSSGPSGGGSR